MSGRSRNVAFRRHVQTTLFGSSLSVELMAMYWTTRESMPGRGRNVSLRRHVQTVVNRMSVTGKVLYPGCVHKSQRVLRKNMNYLESRNEHKILIGKSARKT
jgi:hypothetical protein